MIVKNCNRRPRIFPSKGTRVVISFFPQWVIIKMYVSSRGLFMHTYAGAVYCESIQPIFSSHLLRDIVGDFTGSSTSALSFTVSLLKKTKQFFHRSVSQMVFVWVTVMDKTRHCNIPISAKLESEIDDWNGTLASVCICAVLPSPSVVPISEQEEC